MRIGRSRAVALCLAAAVAGMIVPGVAAAGEATEDEAGVDAGAETWSSQVGGYTFYGRRPASFRIEVPQLVCDAVETGMFSGLMSYDDEGDTLIGGGIESTCESGAVAYRPVAVMADGSTTPADIEATAGDVIAIAYRYLPRTQDVSIELTNLTQGGGAGFIIRSSDPDQGAVHIGDHRLIRDVVKLDVPAFEDHVVSRVRVTGKSPLIPELAQRTRLVTDFGGPTLIRASAPQQKFSQFVLRRV